LADAEHLLESLIHRIRTATDVYRLKTTGVGRLAHLECPTCHRELDINAFQLTKQTAIEVQDHIEALKRDRALTRQTAEAISAYIRGVEASISELDGELNNAQRTLEDVNASVGPVREQIIRAAASLAAQERLIEKLNSTEMDIGDLQTAIDSWLAEAKAARTQGVVNTDIEHRLAIFKQALGQYLIALGHGGAENRGVDTLRLDEAQYEPYIGYRRLRALGSGSDPARLVAAYALALAAASASLNGLHPGMVILDERYSRIPTQNTEHCSSTFSAEVLQRRRTSRL
jgi:DNA repair exonuclease SbcCD ATPase subunit